MALKRVFEPILIGKVEVPNRIARTAHGAHFSHLYVDDAFIAYHAARAKGGCGLSILETAEIDTTSQHGSSIADDSVIARFRNLMSAIRPHGMRVFQQLWHGGHLYPGAGGAPPPAVSTLPGVLGMMPMVGIPADHEEIERLIAAYASAAVRCREGGLDGVEIHAAHGYLIHQFLSPIVNTRTDEYGGSIENRMRFLRRVYRAIRDAVGDDFVVGARFSASEAAGGLGEEDIRTVVRALVGDGLDFVGGALGDYYRMDTMIGGMQFPTGYEAPSSARYMQGLDVPTILAGRYRTLEEAEQALADGAADIIGMVRAQIADPDLVRKSREGRANLVRPCIACNQGCIGSVLRGGRMSCTVNPAVGYEAVMGEELIPAAPAPKRVLIVGGGPAGMEAARVARLRGHEVVLAEATPKLGGAINAAARAADQTALGDITYWLEQEIYRLGVDVRLNTFVELADVEAEAPDITFVATGSMPRMDGIQVANPGEPARGVDQPHVLSSVDFILQKPREGVRSALVLDNVGHFEAVVVAIDLVRRGAAVTMVTHHAGFAPYVQSTLRDFWALDQLNRGEFTLLVRHHLVEIGEASCTVRSLQGHAQQEVAADLVVLVTPNEPLRGLYAQLKDAGRPVQLVGDALSPRDLQMAIATGHHAALELQ